MDNMFNDLNNEDFQDNSNFENQLGCVMSLSIICKYIVVDE
jgi:hypothetical protein